MDQINDILKSVITEIMEIGGNPIPNLDDNIRPLFDLQDFDSLNSVEAEILIADKLGITLKTGVLKWKIGQRPCRISEISGQLSSLLKKKR